MVSKKEWGNAVWNFFHILPSKINETKTHIHIFGAKIKGKAENKESVVTILGEILREIKGLAKIGESLSQNFVIPLISVPP